MRILTKLKLINWHYFIDETIQFANSTLITGDNAAGKSTIIDALQVLLLADLRKLRFNSSAHDQNSMRNIKTYLRGKTGTEGEKEFLRNQDFSSYIVAEILHTKTNQSYLIGVVFDYRIEKNDYEHAFFRIDEATINDSLFEEEGYIRTREWFFRYLKQNQFKFKSYRNDIDNYQADLQQLFGRIKESFFSLLPKGISFSPITNLRKFVYDYLLDEQKIDVETMRDYFNQFEDLKNMIIHTEKEINQLQEIEKEYIKIKDINNKILFSDYMIKRADWQKSENAIQKNLFRIDEESLDLDRYINERDDLFKQKKLVDKSIQDLINEIAKHNITLKINEIKGEIERLKKENQEIQKLKTNISHKVKIEIKEYETLIEKLREIEAPVSFVREVQESILPLEYWLESNFQSNPVDLSNLNDTWVKGYKSISEYLNKIKSERENLQNRKEEIQKRIIDLERNQVLSSDSPSVKLKKLLEEHLIGSNGNKVPVHILCEVIEVRDKRWQNAIEGYLHTQKFDLILPKGYFDDALSLYEQFKITYQIDRVGLVNVDKIIEDRKSPLNSSLAEEIESNIIEAKAYVDFLIGNLIKANTEKELKKHKRSITPSCMVYQNHTARQISKHRYELPYIGKNAVQFQLKQQKQELQKITEAIDQLDNIIQSLSLIHEMLNDKGERYSGWINDWEKIKRDQEIQDKIVSLEEELLVIDQSEVDQLKKKKLEEENKRENLDKIIDEKKELIFRCQNNIKNWNVEITEYQGQANMKMAVYQKYRETIGNNILSAFDTEWETKINKSTPDKVLKKYVAQIEKLKSDKEQLRSPFINLRANFNNYFEFNGDAIAEDNDAYDKRLQVLNGSRLIEYKEKAKEIENKAHEMFQEHFIAKLKENIERAKSDFKQLNTALKEMVFGTDKYTFKVSGKHDMHDYFKLITDPDLDVGVSLFNYQFQEKHGEAISDLFNNILTQETSEEGSIIDYTDYRSYLDFELEVVDSEGNVQKLTKVALEKSGGETQVPFYVAILASFYQSYQMYRNVDTLRLVIFDEAFNRMDADRVEEAIRFITEMGFQAIIVAPTGKIQLIAPHLSNTLIVLKDGFSSEVEQVTREELEQWIEQESEEV